MHGSSIVKPTRSRHHGIITNKLSFHEAYEFAFQNPGVEYYTSGNDTPFTVKATIAGKGNHKNQKVLIFRTERSSVYAYEYCWGHETNCSGTWIDCFTPSIEGI